MVNPYIDEQHEDFFIRTFDAATEDDELVWHRDRFRRTVYVLAGKGWQLQYDNEEPMDLVKGIGYFIPEMHYHRLLRKNECNDTLVLKIEEAKTPTLHK